jgi:tRNA(Arg) A34 adenosine deaminase TadA
MDWIKLKKKFILSFLENKNINKEIPSFSQIYIHGHLISEAWNQVEEKKQSSQHSEIICINQAQSQLNSKYLNECILISLMEPCLMCTGNIIHSKIDKVIYLLTTKKNPGISSLNLEFIYQENHFPKLIYSPSRYLKKELETYFKKLRNV